MEGRRCLEGFGGEAERGGGIGGQAEQGVEGGERTVMSVGFGGAEIWEGGAAAPGIVHSRVGGWWLKRGCLLCKNECLPGVPAGAGKGTLQEIWGSFS